MMGGEGMDPKQQEALMKQFASKLGESGGGSGGKLPEGFKMVHSPGGDQPKGKAKEAKKGSKKGKSYPEIGVPKPEPGGKVRAPHEFGSNETEDDRVLRKSFVMKDDAATVGTLLGEEGSVFSVDMNGQTHLHLAALRSRHKVLNALLAAGSDPNKRDNAGCTPIFMAAYAGFPGGVSALLEAGADLTVVDELGNTPLHDLAGAGRYISKRFHSPAQVVVKHATPPEATLSLSHPSAHCRLRPARASTSLGGRRSKRKKASGCRTRGWSLREFSCAHAPPMHSQTDPHV